MTHVAVKNTDELIKGLRIDGHYIECPFCGQPMMTCESAVGSAFTSHFFSKKHADQRPDDPELADKINAVVKRVSRAAKKAERQAQKDLKEAQHQAKIAEAARLRKKHQVTGAFLDSIVEEMQGLIMMMEPYYSQGDGACEARLKIAEIREITGQPLDD